MALDCAFEWARVINASIPSCSVRLAAVRKTLSISVYTSVCHRHVWSEESELHPHGPREEEEEREEQRERSREEVERKEDHGEDWGVERHERKEKREKRGEVKWRGGDGPLRNYGGTLLRYFSGPLQHRNRFHFRDPLQRSLCGVSRRAHNTHTYNLRGNDYRCESLINSKTLS